jgi:hypothetical protein
MNWNTFMGIVSTLALLLPPALIVGMKLYTNRSLQALFIYYLSTAVYNLMTEGIIPVDTNTRKIFGTINNYMDTPLMLMFLMFFCAERWKAKAINITLPVFLAYELFIGFRFGFTTEANVFILGPGIIIVLLFSLFLFARYIKLSIVQSKAIGRTLMLTSIIFSYGCFGIIYLFHYIQKLKAVNDIFLLYYISSFFTSVIMAAGIFFIKQHLQTLNELKKTRKELQVFFNN